MGIEQKILVRGASLGAGVASALCAVALLTACGQKGNLYMPNDPEFKQRATLPDIVRRQLPGNTAATAATPASSAASAPTTAPRKTTAPAAPSPANAASASGR
ncbi:lipoprotein [Limnohabitans sp. TS-CS-82]|uniref:LPS translocon maturation chaperone LptM n=1 Tax=Limnohabitans sp. TS-CS-82 TaxID=2094193 RepID=UPI0011AFF14B|nr:lipoprotein [Limnohabitans sp. TS-CS-82]